jgi:thiol-disulfide isomerase/thioredoxin
MKKIILITLFSLAFGLFVNAQTIQQINNSDSVTILLTERVQGFGPKGFWSSGLMSLDGYDSTGLLAYPSLRGLPDSLSGLKKYCLILDDYQFYYQNYKKGIDTKEDFLEMVKNRGWYLGDTIYLTKNMVKNTISVVAGYDLNKSIVYMVDANNNSDFSDDTLRNLYSDLYQEEDILANSYYVDFEFYDGRSIKKDKILLHVETFRGMENELGLFFNCPEFFYTKIKYENKIYLICRESYNPDKAIHVLEDKLYFSGAGNEGEVKPNQYINFGNEYYTYMPGSAPGIIEIKRVNISKDKVNKPKTGKSYRHIPVAEQIGMMAPPVSGLNVINGSTISLEKYSGKYVFLDFWGTFCGPCIVEFPNLLKAYETFDRSNFEIIGIVKDDTDGKIKKFMKDRNVIWPNISMDAPKSDISGYKIGSYPTTYLIDPDGKIIATDLRGDDLIKKLELLKVKKN